MSKTVLFQTILFSISTWFGSIWPIDRTLSGATTPGQSGHESDGNKEIHHISQSTSITGSSPSDCFVAYIRTLIGEDFTSWQRCCQCILQPQLTVQRERDGWEWDGKGWVAARGKLSRVGGTRKKKDQTEEEKKRKRRRGREEKDQKRERWCGREK